MANNTIKRVWKQAGINIEDLSSMLFQAESGGHTFAISGANADGNPVALSGTPAGVFLRPDNTDVALTCSVSNGVVYATLPAECYAVQGRGGVTIFLTSGGQKSAIYAAVVSIGKTTSGNVSPGTTASVVDLINAINAAIAQIPASDTNLKAAMAPTYSTSAVYAVGDYAWNNGVLYRCTTAITSGETWMSGHWTAAAIGSDSAAGLRDLKSAFDQIANASLITKLDDNKYVNPDNGNVSTLSGYSATPDYIDVLPNTTYSISRNGKIYGAVYKENHSVDQSITRNDTSTEPIIITTSSEAKYIRISCQTANKSAFGLYKNGYGTPSINDIVNVPGMMERLHIIETKITHSNYSSLLPDVNNILSDTVYTMYFSLRSTDIPAHLPFTRWITNTSVSLITFGTNSSSAAGSVQMLIGANFVFYRQYASSWGNWKAIYLEVNVGNGYGVEKHFESLTEAVEFASSYYNAIVNVYNGTYDLYQEFIDLYGSDFFTTFTNSSKKGIYLNNGVKLKFSGNSKVVFNFSPSANPTENERAVMSQFSPFNYLSGSYGFTI